MLPSIRFWYWDGVYKEMEEAYRAKVLESLQDTATIEEIEDTIHNAPPPDFGPVVVDWHSQPLL
jgi:hypothetical protein